MFIALINLDREPERLAEFVRMNGHLEMVTRYCAVDGKSLDTQALTARGLIDPAIFPTYTKGALGNACSHLALWEMAVKDARAVTVCEDDAILSRHFAACADGLIDLLPADWDIVLWGWNFDSWLYLDMLPGVSPALVAFDQDAMRAGIDNFRDHVPTPRLFRLLRAFGSPCYSVSPKGAAILRRHCLPLRPMQVHFPGLDRTLANKGIDIMMIDLYPGMNAFVSFPPLAITKNRHDISTSLNDL